MYGFIYTKSEFAEGALKEGIFRLSKASHFRSMEVEGSLIPDKLDSGISYDLSNLSTEDIISLKEKEVEKINSLSNDNQSNNYFPDSSLKRFRDFWIFCLSDSRNNKSLLSEGRDCIIKVNDITKFANIIHKYYPDMLGPPQAGRVLYRLRSGDPRKILLIEDEFYKDPIFSQQREIRIRWSINLSLDKDINFVYTKCPELCPLMERIL